MKQVSNNGTLYFWGPPPFVPLSDSRGIRASSSFARSSTFSFIGSPRGFSRDAKCFRISLYDTTIAGASAWRLAIPLNDSSQLVVVLFRIRAASS